MTLNAIYPLMTAEVYLYPGHTFWAHIYISVNISIWISMRHLNFHLSKTVLRIDCSYEIHSTCQIHYPCHSSGQNLGVIFYSSAFSISHIESIKIYLDFYCFSPPRCYHVGPSPSLLTGSLEVFSQLVTLLPPLPLLSFLDTTVRAVL